jgi:hypothetical protein
MSTATFRSVKVEDVEPGAVVRWTGDTRRTVASVHHTGGRPAKVKIMFTEGRPATFFVGSDLQVVA